MVTIDWWPWYLPLLLTPVLSACMRHIVAFTMWGTNNKQWLDEVFVISRIIKVDVSTIARLKRILCNLWTPRLSIDWHHQPLYAKYRSTLDGHIGWLWVDMSINMLVYTWLIWRSVYRPTYPLTCRHYRPICQSTCQHSLGWLSINTSANMLIESRVTDVSGEIDRGLANMSTDQPIWRPRVGWHISQHVD